MRAHQIDGLMSSVEGGSLLGIHWNQDQYRPGEQAVVEVQADGAAGEVTSEAIIEHVKGKLAGYTAPRRVQFVPTIGRSPAGKVDYARLKREATAWADVDA